MSKTANRPRRSSIDVQKEKVRELRGQNSSLKKQVRILESRMLSVEKRLSKLEPRKSHKTKKEVDRAKMLSKYHPDFNKD